MTTQAGVGFGGDVVQPIAYDGLCAALKVVTKPGLGYQNAAITHPCRATISSIRLQYPVHGAAQKSPLSPDRPQVQSLLKGVLDDFLVERV
jgi:hypothetical protein